MAKQTFVSNIFDGITFVVTGEPVNFTRIELKKIIEDNMGRVSSSVSKKTDYLIVCDNTSNKIAKAKELGVKMITEDEFIKMLS